MIWNEHIYNLPETVSQATGHIEHIHRFDVSILIFTFRLINLVANK